MQTSGPANPVPLQVHLLHFAFGAGPAEQALPWEGLPLGKGAPCSWEGDFGYNRVCLDKGTCSSLLLFRMQTSRV